MALSSSRGPSSAEDLGLGGAVAHGGSGLLLPAAALLHEAEDGLEGLDVAGDPERALVPEPELLLGLPEQLRECPVAQVLGGDHEPPHLLAHVHREGAPRHAAPPAALAARRRRRRHRRQLLPLLQQLLQPHDVPDLVAPPATTLMLLLHLLVLLHCRCRRRARNAHWLLDRYVLALVGGVVEDPEGWRGREYIGGGRGGWRWGGIAGAPQQSRAACLLVTSEPLHHSFMCSNRWKFWFF